MFMDTCESSGRGCTGFFFFQAEDGIRDAQESRGLGDVYKRQALEVGQQLDRGLDAALTPDLPRGIDQPRFWMGLRLSLIHI